jgi:arylsulfatase A-like enzyme
MRFTGVVAAGLQLSAAVASGASNGQIFLGDNHHNRPGYHHGGTRPNIVFVLTDDQDLHMDSLNYIPLIKKHLIDRGTLFKRHYCTTAICCPARVSLWTGKLAHNTNVTDVNPPHGMRY